VLGVPFLLAAASAVAREAAPSYEASVERYARGEQDEGLASLILASPETLKSLARGARGNADAAFRAAEIVLHLDIALARLGDEGLNGFGRRVDVLDGLDRKALGDAFRSRWRLAVAAVYLRSNDTKRSRKQVERALEIAKDDPLLLVVRGATFEQEATGGPAPGVALGVIQDRRFIENYLRTQAREAYERAVRIEPQSLDARLRLARSLADEGEPGPGIEHAEWVRDHATAADLRYVALLLCGRDRERRGAFREAAELYLEAGRVDARGSVAVLAASHASQAMGDRDQAGELLFRALRARDAEDYVDAWQGYLMGRPAWLQDARALLRGVVTAP